MNSFGEVFRVTTFGESHGKGIGCVIDGVPSGLRIDAKMIQDELDRRKPGKNIYSTPRKEDDEVEILSGVFEDLSTGTPIALWIKNKNQKSKDYGDIKDIFRPSHGDFTYFKKYGIRDYRGGGRSSARETAARVGAGAIAKAFLDEIGIKVQSGVLGVGGVMAKKEDFEFAQNSEIYALDEDMQEEQKKLIESARNAHDSIGAVVKIKASGMPCGLGEPMYDKLDAVIAKEMMGINGVKAVEIGEGVGVSALKGSQNNDQMDKSGFLSNRSGGILAGISSGEDLEIKVHFKPTPSIFLPQSTQNIQKDTQMIKIKGRHDPCIGIRGSVVAQTMLYLILADMVLLNMKTKLQDIKNFYNN